MVLKCMKLRTFLIIIVLLYFTVIVSFYIKKGSKFQFRASNISVIQEITDCYDKPLSFYHEQRGNYWVLYNYVRALKRHRCFESVTYTTPADYTFLDNVLPLIKSWQGPISVALYAPGHDFQSSLESIAYLRNCENASSLIKQYVTFHLFFDFQHVPRTAKDKNTKTPLFEYYKDEYDCTKQPPFTKTNKTYRTASNLTYPINVARNIARITAQTHFIFASDIELYPSANLIPKFLSFVKRNREHFVNQARKVFVLPVFEVLKNETAPSSKTALQTMLRSNRAVSFHKRLCNICHAIPKESEWISLKEKNELNVFVTTKRQKEQKHWEPFYIGTHSDPLFDERLTWEGQSNKMTQNYALCLLDYDFVVLDNSFLVHKPGIKKMKVQLVKHKKLVAWSNTLIKLIKPELRALYGNRKQCTT